MKSDHPIVEIKQEKEGLEVEVEAVPPHRDMMPIHIENVVRFPREQK